MKETGRGRLAETKGQTEGLVTEEGGPVLELNYYEKASPYDTPYVPGESMDPLAFQVDNLEKALAEARKAGHPVVLDVKTATSRWACIQDPNGIWIELFP